MKNTYAMRKFLILGLVIVVFTGCARVVRNVSDRVASNITAAILNQDDPDTVRDGAPAYLLFVESMIDAKDPDPGMLLAAAKLYSAYASIFVRDQVRAVKLAARAKRYGRQAVCLQLKSLCQHLDAPFVEFQVQLATIKPSNLPAVYGFASAWAGWVEANSADWDAVADIPKLEAVFNRIEALESGYDDGNIYLYLGSLNTLLPPAYGGKPELGRQYFEKALKITEGRNLMAKVLYAKGYARLVFDQALHDRLLNEVLSTPAEYPGLTLINTVAKQRAEVLLAESAEYF